MPQGCKVASHHGKAVFAALFLVRAVVQGTFASSCRGRVGLRGFVARLLRVSGAIEVGHGVAAEVFEVLLHLLHEVDGFVAVAVEEGVGFVALGAGGFELAENLVGALVDASGDEGRNFPINASF